jgi:hypothetical protein
MQKKGTYQQVTQQNYLKSFQKLGFQCLVWAKETTNTKKCNEHFVEEKIGA